MRISTLSKEINEALTVMDHEFALAKKVMGVKPKLEEATLRARNANVALHQVVELIMKAQLNDVLMPPDVIARVNSTQVNIIGIYTEIAMCDRIVETRQRLRPANHMMN